ncbi:hypothetical protein DFH09DRAFT_1067820 [Mycena vulgaris]|nr:hypothetical protein DFH09DRAFT_1067820 [Mycena vulgaris]
MFHECVQNPTLRAGSNPRQAQAPGFMFRADGTLIPCKIFETAPQLNRELPVDGSWIISSARGCKLNASSPLETSRKYLARYHKWGHIEEIDPCANSELEVIGEFTGGEGMFKDDKNSTSSQRAHQMVVGETKEQRTGELGGRRKLSPWASARIDSHQQLIPPPSHRCAHATPAAAERRSSECAVFAAAHGNTPAQRTDYEDARDLAYPLCCHPASLSFPPPPVLLHHPPTFLPHARSPASVISTSEGCKTINDGRTAAGYMRFGPRRGRSLHGVRGSALVWDAPASLLRLAFGAAVALISVEFPALLLRFSYRSRFALSSFIHSTASNLPTASLSQA